MIDPAKGRLPLDPSIHSSARPLLTIEMEPLLRGYLGVVDQYARQHALPIKKVEISGFLDPEEGDEQLVIALWLGLPAKEALAQWHEVGIAIEDWVNGLSNRQADAIAQRISLEVYSNADDAAA